MNTRQLEKCLKADPVTAQSTLGVFARNHLPDRIPEGCGLIMNTDPSDKEGRHWLALYNNGSRTELFDSYGGAGKEYQMKNLIEMPTRLQGTLSAVCGQYCLYYLYHRLRGYSIADVYSNFGFNYLDNDEIVCNFVNEMYSLDTIVYDESILVNQLCEIFEIKC